MGTCSSAISVRPYAEKEFWRHGQRFLLMSATVLHPELMLYELGCPQSMEPTPVGLDSTFPAERRLVHYSPVASLNHRNKDETWPKLAETVAGIVDQLPHQRIFVYNPSYELARYLAERLPPQRVVSYPNAAGREDALARYRALPGAVLMAAGMDRGVDLPDEECDLVIVTKVPFAPPTDSRVEARLAQPGGSLWYDIDAIRKIVQASGRGMRSATDSCHTLILDGAFLALWLRNGRHSPKWRREAVRGLPGTPPAEAVVVASRTPA